jgi:hypothetical protein
VALARAAIALARQLGDTETLLATLHSAGAALVDFTAPDGAAILRRHGFGPAPVP